MTLRPHLLPVAAVLGLTLALSWVRYATAAPAEPAGSDGSLVERGERLFERGCVSCHGIGGAGTEQGPSLLEAGAASADFMLTTGRMPLSRTGIQAPRKEPAYPPEEIDALVAYVASLGDGPPIPDVRPEDGDLADGGELYRLNCAACHQASGAGGPLSSGAHAPALDEATAVQIGEAVLIGPGQMPDFAASLTDDDINSISRYVLYLRDPADPGGLSLGRTGPVAEGFVAWIVGIGLLLIAIRWITRERGGSHDNAAG